MDSQSEIQYNKPFEYLTKARIILEKAQSLKNDGNLARSFEALEGVVRTLNKYQLVKEIDVDVSQESEILNRLKNKLNRLRRELILEMARKL